MATKKESYRALRAELDDVIDRMQAPDVDIEQSLILYKKGQELINKLQVFLDSAKVEIETFSQPKSK